MDPGSSTGSKPRFRLRMERIGMMSAYLGNPRYADLRCAPAWQRSAVRGISRRRIHLNLADAVQSAWESNLLK